MTGSVIPMGGGLPVLVDRAAAALASAKSAAEILDARDLAGIAYDAAKRFARLTEAKGAHDELVAKALRAQADALKIESLAKARLADEYDAAQERGEVRANGERSFSAPEKVSGPEVIPPKELHEARRIRDAEKAKPGIVNDTIEAALADHREPTKAIVRRAIAEVKTTPMSDTPKRRPSAARSKIDSRIERQRLNGQIWSQLRDALANLSGLPLPADVAATIAGNNKATIVNDHLAKALHWLQEFSDAWRNRHQAGPGKEEQDRDDPADARTGDEAA